jgi:hypothetical protein
VVQLGAGGSPWEGQLGEVDPGAWMAPLECRPRNLLRIKMMTTAMCLIWVVVRLCWGSFQTLPLAGGSESLSERGQGVRPPVR